MDQDELADKYDAVLNGKKVEDEEQRTYTYDELLNLSFKLLLNTGYYEKQGNIWIDKSEDEDYIKQKLENTNEKS